MNYSGRRCVFPMSSVEYLSSDPVFDVELEIARRADHLAKEHRDGENDSLECWLRAEAEVLGVAGARPVILPMQEEVTRR